MNNDNRDLRDPEKLGKKYLAARKRGRSIATAVRLDAPISTTHPTCIEKYGRPDEVQELWERIQIK